MITTIDDDTNGFRRELIPMALSSPNASARSLLQATLALSSFHLGRPEEALKHKVKAINALSESFKVADTSRVAQFAACMMLCVYSVGTPSIRPHVHERMLKLKQVFDATDTTWHLHLQGAKNIEYAFSQYEREQPCLEFLQPWFDYHDTFSRYSHRVDPRCLGRHIILPESTAANRKVSLTVQITPTKCNNPFPPDHWTPGLLNGTATTYIMHKPTPHSPKLLYK